MLWMLPMISHHRKKGNGDGPDGRSEHLLTHKHHRYHKLNLWFLQNLMMYQMRTIQLYILHHHQLDHHHQHREVAPQKKTKNLGRKSEHFHFHLLRTWMEVQKTVDPQTRVTDRSRSPQEQEGPRRQGPHQQKERNILTESSRVHPQKTKKYKPMNSDEDDEEPRNPSATSSNAQPIAPALPYNSGDEDSEFSDEYSADSQDSGRTVFYPDLHAMTNDEHWTRTPDFQVCSSDWIILLFNNWTRKTTRQMQFDYYAVCATIILPQWSDPRLRQHKSWTPSRSWWSNMWYVRTLYGYLRKGCRNKSQNEISCMKGSISPREVLGYHKQNAEAKHLESQILGWQRSCSSHWHEKGGAEKLCYRTMCANHVDSQARQLSQSKGQMGIKRLPRQTERKLTHWFTCFHKARISNALSSGRQSWMASFHIDLKNSFFWRTIL